MTSSWVERPFSISDVQLTRDEAYSLGPEGLAEWMAGMGFTAVQIASPDMAGGEGTFLREPYEPAFYRDYFEALRRRGIAVVFYCNVHWLLDRDVGSHPDWPQRLEDGGPVPISYGSGSAPCVNGPWRDWALAGMRSSVEKYRLDGLFLDGPVFYPGACYCPACISGFRTAFGADPPAWGSWGSRAWADFVTYRARSIERFVADCRAMADEMGVAVFMNNQCLSPGWSHGNQSAMLPPHLHILGNERPNLYRGSPLMNPTWMPVVAAQALEGYALGKPRVIFGCFRHLPWNYTPLTPVEMELLLAGTLAAGANPHIMGGRRYLKPLEGVVRRMLHYHQRNGTLLTRTEPASRVAVLWSDATQLHHLAGWREGPAGERKRLAEQTGLNEFYGCCELLTRLHVPFHLLNDRTREGPSDLDRCRTVFLPDAACAGEGLLGRLTAFVASGGKLVASFESLAFDETGGLREGGDMSGLFGCVPSVEERRKALYVDDLTRDYVEVSSSVAGLSQALQPAPTTVLRVRLTDGEALAWHYERLPSAYFPLRQPSEPVPGIVRKVHPNGGMAVLFTGTFFGAYWQNRFPDYLRLVKALCLDDGDLPVRLEGAPQTVQIVLRRSVRDGRPPVLLIHLLNHTGEMQRPIEEVLPVTEVRVGIARAFLEEHLGGAQGDLLVTGLPEADPFPVTDEGDSFVIRVSRLECWLTLVVRRAQAPLNDSSPDRSPE